MSEIMDALRDWLLLLIPLMLLQFGLMVVALVHIFRHEKYKTGTRLMWVIICVCANIIGPVLYFILGKSEE
jgi:hypothetical protein